MPEINEKYYSGHRKRIATWVLTQLGEMPDAAYIKDIEENCGSIWITLDNGKTYSIQIIECEPEQS